jgi:hypothetical protein
MLTREETAGTSLEVLAPYLPYKVEMAWSEAPYDMLGMGYYLRSLSDFEGHEVAISHRASRESFDWYSYKSVLPVLRPFSALCTPLEDGTVPAVEVALMCWGIQSKGTRHFSGDYKARSLSGGNLIEVTNHQGTFRASMYHNANESSEEYRWSFWRTEEGAAKPAWNQHGVIDYLRSKHFAVGLAPHQFIEASPSPSAPTTREKEEG